MKIVSMAQNVPGPVAVARLVAGGASAIKIEPPSGDPLEAFCKPWYDELHAGVTVARLDLKSSDGMRSLMDLLGSTDVFIASHRPGALAAPRSRRRRPRLALPSAPPLEHRRRHGAIRTSRDTT